MIFVDGIPIPFSTHSSSTSHSQVRNLLHQSIQQCHWYRVDFLNFQLLMNREWRFYLLCWKILFSYPPQPLSRQTQRRSSQFQKDQNGFIYSKENLPLLIQHLSMYATFSPFVISIIISKVTIMFFLQCFTRDDAC